MTTLGHRDLGSESPSRDAAPGDGESNRGRLGLESSRWAGLVSAAACWAFIKSPFYVLNYRLKFSFLAEIENRVNHLSQFLKLFILPL